AVQLDPQEGIHSVSRGVRAGPGLAVPVDGDGIADGRKLRVYLDGPPTMRVIRVDVGDRRIIAEARRGRRPGGASPRIGIPIIEVAGVIVVKVESDLATCPVGVGSDDGRAERAGDGVEVVAVVVCVGDGEWREQRPFLQLLGPPEANSPGAAAGATAPPPDWR